MVLLLVLGRHESGGDDDAILVVAVLVRLRVAGVEPDPSWTEVTAKLRLQPLGEDVRGVAVDGGDLERQNFRPRGRDPNKVSHLHLGEPIEL